jgi:hypothetical protein
MKTLLRFGWLPLAALALFSLPATARPLLVPAQTLEFPPNFFRGYGDIAVDEGTLLVTNSRQIDTQPGYVQGVYIFERDTAGHWAYAGVLTEQWTGDLRIDGNVATVRSNIGEGIRVFERGATGWSLSGVLPVVLPNAESSAAVVRIEDGSIFTQTFSWDPAAGCMPPFEEYRKVNGAWTRVATIGGEQCQRAELDVNDAQALVVHWDYEPSTPERPAEVFTTGRPAWTLTGTVAQPGSGPLNFLGVFGTIRGDTAYFSNNYIYRNSGGAWLPAGRLLEPERDLMLYSSNGRLRGNHLFLSGEERDYLLPFFDGTPNDRPVVRVYRQTTSGAFTYHARLNAEYSIVRWSVSDDGRQVAALGSGRNSSGYSEDNELYVFEVPDTATFLGTRQETFEAGNYANWTATAGSFGVVTSGVTRVLRQSSVSGESGAYLSAIDWRDQSIEADMRPLQFAETDRWFGLVTRRADAQNYYYVTFRSPNVISLRRMRNGVYTELGRAQVSANFQVGRNYRVRLESVADQHVVFVDGFPLVRAKDNTLAQGHPGVAGYRTRFDLDNVTVSGGTRVLLRLDSGRRAWSDGWQQASGTWELTGTGQSRYLRQTDPEANARWVSTVAAGYQVVSARVRPQALGTSSDPWIGLATHWVDDSNYYYLTLRRSQTLSLRRLVNGQIQEIATVPQAMTLGAWHDLRLEIVGTRIRAFVNGDLRIERTIPELSGSYGRNALLLWKTAADVESYIAYQP